MSEIDVIEEAERRTRLRFYRDLVTRLATVPSEDDPDARETYEYHVGDVAWATHLMAKFCGREAVLDVLAQLGQQLAEPEYWQAIKQQEAAAAEVAAEFKDTHPELWQRYLEVVSK